jgi:hypothetical protein
MSPICSRLRNSSGSFATLAALAAPTRFSYLLRRATMDWGDDACLSRGMDSPDSVA